VLMPDPKTDGAFLLQLFLVLLDCHRVPQTLVVLAAPCETRVFRQSLGPFSIWRNRSTAYL